MKTDYHIKQFYLIILFQLFICLAVTKAILAQPEDTTRNKLKIQPEDSTISLSTFKDIITEVVKKRVELQHYFTLSYNKTMACRIGKEAEVYKLPDGESGVALFELPDYQKKYVLTIRSFFRGIGYTYHVFAPTGIFLDSSFQPTHLLAEKQFSTARPFLTVLHLKAEVVVDDDRKNDKYLLIYTSDKNKEALGAYSDWSQGILVGLLKHPVNGSPDGKLELEVRGK